MTSRVSVIMPSFNMARYIGSALRSILLQGHEDIEVIIADCTSTDETRAVVAESSTNLDVKVVEVESASAPGIARNAALEQTSGDIVAFLDADDLWPAGKQDRQLQYLSAHSDLGMVSGYVRYFDRADETGLGPAQDSRTEDLVHVHVGACLYRRTTLDRIGHFDRDLRYAEDVDLILRLREAGIPFAILRTIELYYRRHPGSLMASSTDRKAHDFRLATLKSLSRRRAAGIALSPLPDFASYVVP